ncbi:hypothetical protein J1605_013445 [Eschrichtius robustus]|uniref:Uncharacterized protein n=1 Tax=Eschrichtius robustus TaxID=9764 RepID=A0AB34GHI5_ESCRO|nr:hypothetical protein J1605_013445 [Eschrichtius robustus]
MGRGLSSGQWALPGGEEDWRVQRSWPGDTEVFVYLSGHAQPQKRLEQGLGAAGPPNPLKYVGYHSVLGQVEQTSPRRPGDLAGPGFPAPPDRLANHQVFSNSAHMAHKTGKSKGLSLAQTQDGDAPRAVSSADTRAQQAAGPKATTDGSGSGPRE